MARAGLLLTLTACLPRSAQAWYREGRAAEGLKRWEDAATAYYEAAQLEVSCSNCHRSMEQDRQDRTPCMLCTHSAVTCGQGKASIEPLH